MSRVALRCVIPNTTEAKIENKRAALKCESSRVILNFRIIGNETLTAEFRYGFFPIAM